MNVHGPEHKRLSQFVGTWNTSGRIMPEDHKDEIIIKGTDTYEWLPGRFFLLHTVDVMIGEDRNQTYEIISFDKATGNYVMRYFDNKGTTGEMMAWYADNDKSWTFLGTSLRFKGRFNGDNSILSGIWERRADENTWKSFIEITLHKIN